MAPRQGKRKGIRSGRKKSERKKTSNGRRRRSVAATIKVVEVVIELGVAQRERSRSPRKQKPTYLKSDTSKSPPKLNASEKMRNGSNPVPPYNAAKANSLSLNSGTTLALSNQNLTRLSPVFQPACGRYKFERGFITVICNQTFLGPYKTRYGADLDIQVILQSFTMLGFVVDLHIDLSADKMLQVTAKLAAFDFTQYDVAGIFVLSHGDEGVVIGSDGQKINLHNLLQPMQLNLSLAGKPKINFIESCRGNQEIVGPFYNLQSTTGTSFTPSLIAQADTIIAFATMPGFISYTETAFGSPFTQNLCHLLLQMSPSFHLTDILTQVHKAT